jgi:glycosyltransferase involved in cell wall biosynthesis
LRRLLSELAPDLLNAHYATGYGLLARLSGYTPTMLSVWGSDVYDFPCKSSLHRKLVGINIEHAALIGSTSYCMARKVREIAQDANIVVTPFGVDAARFHRGNDRQGRQHVVIGTVKTLAQKYGIDILIEAFAKLCVGRTAFDLSLEITGEGPQRAELESLAHVLGVRPNIIFHGAVAHDKVPLMLGRLDVFVALSRHESFGVAAVEAAMCGLPVLVSDADGLAEVVEDGVTGFVVPRGDPDAAAQALARLAGSEKLRKQMGEAGRERALALYTWEKSLDIMIEAYKQTIESVEQRIGRGTA